MVEQLSLGSTVAGFRLEELIGEGATGRVFRASDGENRTVALKLLAPELARDERFRKRFLRESRLAAGLEDPHVVPVLEAGEADGILYLAMRLVDGPDLREILASQSPLEPELALAIVGQVATALDAAHRAGLVHRDVKPANVLLEGEHAYLCDFGLARHVSSVSSLTTERGFVGTIDYIAPEQIEGQGVDRQADVYSLGCLLFECLSGARPFARESDLATVFAHLNEDPPPISEIRPELPQELDTVFSTALAKVPDERYASCGELVAAVRAGLEGRTFVRRRRRGTGLLVGIGALAALIAAVVAFVLTQSGPSPRTRPEITQSAIDGVSLGRTRTYYRRVLGPSRPFVEKPAIQGAGTFPAASFQTPAVGVYFRPHHPKAFIITTWNRTFRTAEGIGPCSTLAQMRSTYGRRAVPTYSGSGPHGVHWSYQLGRNLLFVTQDHKTISSVVLFTGPPNARARNQPPGTYQGDANYLGGNETKCE
jgi:serine/threonine-protein kinase